MYVQNFGLENENSEKLLKKKFVSKYKTEILFENI